MKIRLATDADASLWDCYVEAHQQATPYHRFAWGQAVTQAYGFATRYFLAEQQGAIVGVFPCVQFKPMVGAAKYSALPYCDVGSVLADTADITQQLLDAALADAKQQGYASLESRAIESGELQSDSDHAQQKVSMRLALPESSEALLAGFKSKLRSQIRKAEKNGLRYEVGRSTELLQHFYEVMCVNMRALGSPVHSYSWFEQVIAHYQDSAVISVVYHQDVAIGAGIVLSNGHLASIPWASTKADYNRLAPNMLLYWSLLAHCCDRGMQTFDFGRSTFGEGTFKFKAQWGAKPVALQWQTFVNGVEQQAEQALSGSALKQKIKALIIFLWQRMPMPVTTKLGPLLRKNIDL